jgi:hypothetical protein
MVVSYYDINYINDTNEPKLRPFGRGSNGLIDNNCFAFASPTIDTIIQSTLLLCFLIIATLTYGSYGIVWYDLVVRVIEMSLPTSVGGTDGGGHSSGSPTHAAHSPVIPGHHSAITIAPFNTTAASSATSSSRPASSPKSPMTGGTDRPTTSAGAAAVGGLPTSRPISRAGFVEASGSPSRPGTSGGITKKQTSVHPLLVARDPLAHAAVNYSFTKWAIGIAVIFVLFVVMVINTQQ